MVYVTQYAQYVLLFLVLAVISVWFQILWNYTLLLKLHALLTEIFVLQYRK